MDPFLGIIGLVLSFGIAMVLVIKKLNYGLALTLGAIVLGLFFEQGPGGLLNVVYFTITDMTTLELVAAVVLIPVLAKSLVDTGLMDTLIQGLKSKLSARAVLAIIPAAFGIFTMTGGALISAPMIDGEGSKLEVSAEKKSIINLWFRHVWFCVSPLVPTLIIIQSMTGVSLYSIILINMPIFIVHTTVGYILLIRPIRNNDRLKSSENLWYKVGKSSAPIVITVIVNILGLPLSLSLLTGVVSALILGKFNLRKSAKTIKDGLQWGLVVAAFGSMYFRYMIQFAGVDKFIVSYANSLGVPMIAFLTAIPLIFGFITANPTTSAIISVSLVTGYMENLTAAQISLLYVSSFMSYFVSPLHLCLILTVGYFKPKLKGVYKWLLPLAAMDYVIALITGFLLLGLV